jgi:hypothetical protein
VTVTFFFLYLIVHYRADGQTVVWYGCFVKECMLCVFSVVVWKGKYGCWAAIELFSDILLPSSFKVEQQVVHEIVVRAGRVVVLEHAVHIPLPEDPKLPTIPDL